jgi:transcriptional regulator with XRE-family HTH domain
MSEQGKDRTVAERFGANLMWLRCRAGISQQELADLTEMHRAQVAALERGGRNPRLDTILRLAAGLGVSACDLIAWIWWEPARHYHYETPPSMAAVSGYEVLDFDLPAGFRVASIGYETDEEFRARLKERTKKDRPVLELLRDDALPLPPRERPDAAWVLRTGRALRALRAERGLTRQQLADRSPTTAEFIGEIEEGRCSDPGLRMLEALCRVLDGEGSALSAQIEPVRAERKSAVQKVLDELAARDAREAER